jgi:hypothetical protein
MLVLATVLSGAVAAVDPIARASEVPELASMALLSVLLVGVSVAVRRVGPKSESREAKDVPRDPKAAPPVSTPAR